MDQACEKDGSDGDSLAYTDGLYLYRKVSDSPGLLMPASAFATIRGLRTSRKWRGTREHSVGIASSELPPYSTQSEAITVGDTRSGWSPGCLQKKGWALRQ